MKDPEAQVIVSASDEPGHAVTIVVKTNEEYAIIHLQKDTAMSVAQSILELLSQGDA